MFITPDQVGIEVEDIHFSGPFNDNSFGFVGPMLSFFSANEIP